MAFIFCLRKILPYKFFGGNFSAFAGARGPDYFAFGANLRYMVFSNRNSMRFGPQKWRKGAKNLAARRLIFRAMPNHLEKP